jgi:hypothetical protein
MIKVVPISVTGKMLKAFIDYPHELYRGDKNYVPELFIAQRDLLTPGKHPFHLHSQMQLFLAYDKDRIAGRIAAIINGNHNAFNNVQDGFFGFFDCENNQQVADALLNAAKEWIRVKGATTMIGPVNPSTNDPCGLLVAGFDLPPIAMMPYNKPYYITLLENYGLHKKVDLFAHALYAHDVGDKPVRLYDALIERLQKKGITIRRIDLKKNFKEELKRFGKVYNAAWDKNMGFVPLTPEEFNFMGKDLKMIADPDFCLVAEHEGEIVGISLCVPDINQILIKIKKGRLLPTGIFRLLFGRKKINAIRIMALGVLEPYRKMGIEACFYAGIMKSGLGKGIKMAEASWILEHNDMMNRAIEHINGHVYKKYRLYEKSLS